MFSSGDALSCAGELARVFEAGVMFGVLSSIVEVTGDGHRGAGDVGSLILALPDGVGGRRPSSIGASGGGPLVA